MSTARKIERKRTGGLRLSLCMIVKNEADNLEQCLSTARPHVDEIVIVDTGSTDGTQEIARRYADVFDEIEWPDSFALARNHSLDLVTGDYVIILDGDEFLPDPLHWRRIRKALAGGDVAALRVVVRNLLPEGQLISADRMIQERVFRNDRRIRYQGRVHNQLFEGLVEYINATGSRIVKVSAEIIHTGYAHEASRMKEKYSVRLHLLKDEYASAKDAERRSYYGYQLGVVYYVMEQFDKVLDLFGGLEYEAMTDQNAFYTHLLASQAAIALSMPTRALVHCNGMLSLDRGEPVAYQITGLALLQAHQFADGMLMLLEAFSINEDVGKARFVLNTGEIMRNLARICDGAQLSRHATAFRKLAGPGAYDRKEAAQIVQSLKLGLVQSQRAVA